MSNHTDELHISRSATSKTSFRICRTNHHHRDLARGKRKNKRLQSEPISPSLISIPHL